MSSTTSNKNSQKRKTRRQYEAREKYALCKEFDESSEKKYTKFVRDKGLDIDRSVFSRWHKAYLNGQIEPDSSKKKSRPGKYGNTDDKRAESCTNDRVSPNQEVMRDKARNEFSDETERNQSTSSHRSTISNSLHIDDSNSSDSDEENIKMEANTALFMLGELRKYAHENLSEALQKRMKDMHRDIKREINQKK